MSDVIDPGRRARKAARAQSEQIAKQKQVEEAKLAEEESDIARRKSVMAKGRGGRSSLIATSNTGVTNLGGSE